MKSGDPEKHRIIDKAMTARHPIERGAPASLPLPILAPHHVPFSSLEFSPEGSSWITFNDYLEIHDDCKQMFQGGSTSKQCEKFRNQD